jgi:hypothetical protein
MDPPDTGRASSRAGTTPRAVMGAHFTATENPQRDRGLAPDALAFIGALHELFASDVQSLLPRRWNPPRSDPQRPPLHDRIHLQTL